MITRSRLIFLGIGLVVLVGVLWFSGLFDPRNPVGSTISGTRELGETVVKTFTGGGDFKITPETPGYENYQQLIQGCPVKDCIPAIDDPKFESASAGDKWLEDGDVVFGIVHKGVVRAYPQRILNWHEIVNDEIAGDPISVTFCPLCGSAIAFDRRIGGRVLEFGVSGKLHNSDLVMYDRQTESLWQQITGEAIVGELFGTVLTAVRMDTLTWSDWLAAHPDTEVLSRDTGSFRDYDRYPYGSYESDKSVFFPVEGGVDETIHPKDVVFGVEVNGVSKAYPKGLIEVRTGGSGFVDDVVAGARLRLQYDNGELVVSNQSSGEEIVPRRLFWFAWKVFHKDTLLYR